MKSFKESSKSVRNIDIVNKYLPKVAKLLKSLEKAFCNIYCVDIKNFCDTHVTEKTLKSKEDYFLTYLECLQPLDCTLEMISKDRKIKKGSDDYRILQNSAKYAMCLNKIVKSYVNITREYIDNVHIIRKKLFKSDKFIEANKENCVLLSIALLFLSESIEESKNVTYEVKKIKSAIISA